MQALTRLHRVYEGVATAQQVLELRKYLFDRHLHANREADRDDVSRVFNSLSQQKAFDRFVHLYDELYTKPSTAAAMDVKGSAPCFMSGRAQYLCHIKKICDILGLANTFDTETIFTIDAIADNLSTLDQIFEELRVLGVDTRDRSSEGQRKRGKVVQKKAGETSKEMRVKSMISQLLKTFWSGAYVVDHGDRVTRPNAAGNRSTVQVVHDIGSS